MKRSTRQHTNFDLVKVMLALVALVVGAGAFQKPSDASAAALQGVEVDNTQPAPAFDWVTVVNNSDLMPPLSVRNFNSY
ncbi:MAG: hypothetical protein OEZ14_06605, partial [Acidimicrobiia bacterium]|nr:hypothetical protein [Acidimicrobiia bacterium]